MKKLLNIIFWTISIIGFVLIILATTILKFRYSSIVIIILILIELFLQAGIFYLNHKGS